MHIAVTLTVLKVKWSKKSEAFIVSATVYGIAVNDAYGTGVATGLADQG